MNNPMTIGFSNAELERFRQQLRKFNSKKTEKLKKVTKIAVHSIASGARKRCPRVTSRLYTSIRPLMGQTGLAGIVYTNVEYAPYVEFGTIERVEVPTELTEYALQFKGRGIRKKGGRKAKPFLYPAFKEEVPKYIDAIKRVMQQEER